MRYPYKIIIAYALAFLVAGGSIATVHAGQRRAAEPAKADDGTKPLDQMSIEELRAYQAYYYASGGRDPMTMRVPTTAELGDPTKGGGARIAPTLEQMEVFMEKALDDIVHALKALRYEDAIKASEDALYVIDNEWPPLKADPPHLRQMEEQIRNYNRLAVRLKAQQDIKREFEGMSLRVNGVTWSPIDSKAVVNGRVYSAGEIMLNERNSGDLRVEMIDEGGVTFQFKGVRFRLPVEVHSGAAGTPRR